MHMWCGDWTTGRWLARSLIITNLFRWMKWAYIVSDSIIRFLCLCGRARAHTHVSHTERLAISRRAVGLLLLLILENDEQQFVSLWHLRNRLWCHRHWMLVALILFEQPPARSQPTLSPSYIPLCYPVLFTVFDDFFLHSIMAHVTPAAAFFVCGSHCRLSSRAVCRLESIKSKCDMLLSTVIGILLLLMTIMMCFSYASASPVSHWKY